jgi:pantoate kinase
MVSVSAFAPGHVTGFFSVHPHDDPLRHGSTGAGFSVTEGTVTTVSASDRDLLLMNGQPFDGVTSRAVLEMFRERGLTGYWTVAHETSLPIGCGFGTSGAGALSLSLALNELLPSKLAHLDAAAIAHLAEIRAGTGLGTVIGQTYGGFEVRTKAGAPGTGEVVNLPYEGYRAVFAVFGPIETPRLLGDPEVKRAVSREGENLRHQLLEAPSLSHFLELSLNFGRKSGLVSPRLAAIQDALLSEGFTAPMLMFGDGLFTAVENPTFETALAAFRRLAPGAKVFGSDLGQGGRFLVRH